MATRRQLQRVARGCVERGVPPSWFGYRWIRREDLAGHAARRGWRPGAGRFEVVHDERVVAGPLPGNVAGADALPDDRGWWGFSFRDVPARRSAATLLATVPDCRVVWYEEPTRADDFYPAVVTGDDRALELREVRFRRRHGEVLRRAGDPLRLDRATWILERVYHNHAHWLTAHLPKLALLARRGAVDDVVLPPVRPAVVDGSLRLLGLDPDAFPTFDPARSLRVGEMTVLDSDRFRPELLGLVQEAAAGATPVAPDRRVFVSRAGAGRRRLVDEDALWPVLADAGFERVRMEELSFEDQVDLMRRTAVLCGPHGAGLTNMVFCAPGTQVVEIADRSFPNPNFYALATALGHRYWLVGGDGVGDGHPLDRDLRVDAGAVRRVLAELAA